MARHSFASRELCRAIEEGRHTSINSVVLPSKNGDLTGGARKQRKGHVGDKEKGRCCVSCIGVCMGMRESLASPPIGGCPRRPSGGLEAPFFLSRYDDESSS